MSYYSCRVQHIAFEFLRSWVYRSIECCSKLLAPLKHHGQIRQRKRKSISLLPIKSHLTVVRHAYVIFKRNHRQNHPKLHPCYIFTSAIKCAYNQIKTLAHLPHRKLQHGYMPREKGINGTLSLLTPSHRSGMNSLALVKYRSSRWMVNVGTDTIILPGI